MQGAVRRAMAVAIAKRCNAAGGRLAARPAGLAGLPVIGVPDPRRAMSPPSNRRLDDEQAGKPEALDIRAEVP